MLVVVPRKVQALYFHPRFLSGNRADSLWALSFFPDDTDFHQFTVLIFPDSLFLLPAFMSGINVKQDQCKTHWSHLFCDPNRENTVRH